jgi:hypothetical protein
MFIDFAANDCVALQRSSMCGYENVEYISLRWSEEFY